MAVTFEHAGLQTEEFPPGWTLTVDKKPNGRTHFQGHAIWGVAFVDIPRLNYLLTFNPAPGYMCDARSLGMVVTLELYDRDRMRPIRLEQRQIGFVD